MQKVSIILPTFNGEKYIEEAINSILNQTYQNWELIIVDDGSTDKTAEIIKKYNEKDSRIYTITNERNIKLPESLNKGFKAATGEYYTWTSDDNMYKPEAIKTMVEYLNNNQAVDLVSFNEDIADKDGEIEQLLTDLYPDRNILQLTKCCNIGACFMYRKDIAEIVGEYDKDMFCAEDYDYWCRIAVKGNIKYCDESLYIYRRHPKSLSSTRVAEICSKILQIRYTYAIAIMKKLKLSKTEQINHLLNFYNENKENIEWLHMAKNINRTLFCLYKIKNLFI